MPIPLKEITNLVKTGKLYAVQSWLAAGNPIRPSEERVGRQFNLLKQAVESGFHSMVEMLLKEVEWLPCELRTALNSAISNRRKDLIELLLNANAPVDQIDFYDISATVDLEIMEKFLRMGVSPSQGNAFAQALLRYKAKPYLRFYRAFREEFPALNNQVALALSESVNKRNIRWVSLLVWAGADPLQEVPWTVSCDFDDPNETTINAATSACFQKDSSLFRALKIKPTKEQALQLLQSAAYSPCPEIITELLKFILPSEINSKDRQTCEALETLVKHHHRQFDWDIPSWHSPYNREEPELIASIKLLLSHGARWNPLPERMREVRSGLGSHNSRHVVQVIKLLLYAPGVSAFETIWECCRTPKMQGIISSTDSKLWNELKSKI